jgi:hypothetical protein
MAKGHFAKSHWPELYPFCDSNHDSRSCSRSTKRDWMRHTNHFARNDLAFYGAVISAVALIALFFGQRMAKGYAGAAVLVPYFLLALVTIYLLAHDEQ